VWRKEKKIGEPPLVLAKKMKKRSRGVGDRGWAAHTVAGAVASRPSPLSLSLSLWWSDGARV